MAKKKITKKRKQRVEKSSTVQQHFKPKYLFFLLGIAVFVAMIFMFIIFFNERVGITPWFSVIFLEGFTEGENWILFIISIIFAFFVGIFILTLILRKTGTKMV